MEQCRSVACLYDSGFVFSTYYTVLGSSVEIRRNLWLGRRTFTDSVRGIDVLIALEPISSHCVDPGCASTLLARSHNRDDPLDSLGMILSANFVAFCSLFGFLAAFSTFSFSGIVRGTIVERSGCRNAEMNYSQATSLFDATRTMDVLFRWLQTHFLTSPYTLRCSICQAVALAIPPGRVMNFN